jgi:DNA replication protein DnaC
MQRFYNNNQAIIITANGNPKKWVEAGMDARICSRLKEMCVFEVFEGDDYRES